MYGDGADFHMDYYNSFVIQPMLVDIIELDRDQSSDWKDMKERVINRAKRFAVIQERSISPEGTFPVVGRSITYRFGAFQHLAQMALQQRLDESLQPAQIRCALTAVIRKVIEMPDTFDVRWLAPYWSLWTPTRIRGRVYFDGKSCIYVQPFFYHLACLKIIHFGRVKQNGHQKGFGLVK